MTDSDGRACPSVDELQQLLDQSLAGEPRDWMDRHVSACSDCQATLDSLTQDHLPSRPAARPTDSQLLRQTIDNLKNESKQANLANSNSGNTTHLATESVSVRSDGIASHLDIEPVGSRFPDRPRSPEHLGAIGKYAILEAIGSGAAGVLYRAWDSELNRPAAIKVLREMAESGGAGRKRMLREAQSVIRVRHPAVVEVYDVIQREDFPLCLVMELIEGGSLADQLTAGPLPPARAARVAQQAAEGLAAAHENKLVHRDVKPSNLLLTQPLDAEECQVRVADFGLVAVVDHDSQLTRTGDIAGTPAYMSPEQIESPSTVDARGDVYSLGCVLYEMLTGRPPFDGTVRMVLWQVIHDDPKPPRRLDDRIPSDLETICLKAIAKRPEDRYESARDLSDDLQRYLDGQSVVARRPSVLARTLRVAHKYPMATALGAATLVSAAAITLISVLAALQLANAHSDTRLQAAKARQGREIAVEVMESIVFDAYDELESSQYAPDDLQIQLLQAAAAGLARIENERESSETLIHRAETHARLGRALWRSDRLEEAADQLAKAQSLLEPLDQGASDSVDVRRLQLQLYVTQIDTYSELGDQESVAQLVLLATPLASELLALSNPDSSLLKTASEFYQSLAYEAEDSRQVVQWLAWALEAHERLGPVVSLGYDERLPRLSMISELAYARLDIRDVERARGGFELLNQRAQQLLQVEAEEGYIGVSSELLDGRLSALLGLSECAQAEDQFALAQRHLEDAWQLVGTEVGNLSLDPYVLDTCWSIVDAGSELARAEGRVVWLRRKIALADCSAKLLPDDDDARHQIRLRKRLLHLLGETGPQSEADQLRHEIQSLTETLDSASAANPADDK